ncbi:MAG: hypothetical protein ACI87E_003982 [Mariniblastus sp.]|jgi:hypothetical protein
MSKTQARSNKFGFSIVALAYLTSVTLLVGCGGNSDLADVRGVVTLDGKPLPNAFLTFTPEVSGPESTGTACFGKTDADGTYRMMFTDDEFGASLGRNHVNIETGDVSADTDGEKVKEVVPNVYNKESTLYADVNSGKNIIDFDLKSDASNVEQMTDEED